MEMSFVEILLIAISLAMDCFSVSIAAGVCDRNAKWYSVALMSLMFGLFQMAMPYAGYFVGFSFIDYIQRFDHWIAFGILSAIGLNMVFSKDEDGDEKKRDFFSLQSLLLLSVATSIDALATGVVFMSESRAKLHFAFDQNLGYLTECPTNLGTGLRASVMLHLPVLKAQGEIAFAVIGIVASLFSVCGYFIGRYAGRKIPFRFEMLGGVVLILIGAKILVEHLLF